MCQLTRSLAQVWIDSRQAPASVFAVPRLTNFFLRHKSVFRLDCSGPWRKPDDSQGAAGVLPTFDLSCPLDKAPFVKYSSVDWLDEPGPWRKLDGSQALPAFFHPYYLGVAFASSVVLPMASLFTAIYSRVSSAKWWTNDQLLYPKSV